MKTTLVMLLTSGVFYFAKGQIVPYPNSPTYTTNQGNPTIPKKDSIQNPPIQDKSLINQDLIQDKNMNRRDSLQKNQDKIQKRTRTDSAKTKSLH